jgi:Leucine-rich repeat (LRR) protein
LIPICFTLAGNNLVGELPNELGLLIGLEHLSLFYNELAGNLPEDMQFLTLVNFVAMESNLFTGPIPDWISAWTNLEYLALGDNQFSGELPSFAALENLVEVAIDSNYLTGSVDVFNEALALEVLFLQNNEFDNDITFLFSNLENLRILDMNSNDLGGSLPAHFYNFEILDLHNNSISGEMPQILVDDSPMNFLSLFNNDISGAIPDSISSLTGLTHLDLSHNAFTGAIPGFEINKLTDLVYLFLGENPFDFGDFPEIWDLINMEELSLKNARRGGNVPDWISSQYFPELVLLDLHTNGFEGQLPSELGTLSNLSFLLLNKNELTGFLPTSFNNLSNLGT